MDSADPSRLAEPATDNGFRRHLWRRLVSISVKSERPTGLLPLEVHKSKPTEPQPRKQSRNRALDGRSWRRSLRRTRHWQRKTASSSQIEFVFTTQQTLERVGIYIYIYISCVLESGRTHAAHHAARRDDGAVIIIIIIAISISVAAALQSVGRPEVGHLLECSRAQLPAPKEPFDMLYHAPRRSTSVPHLYGSAPARPAVSWRRIAATPTTTAATEWATTATTTATETATATTKATTTTTTATTNR